MNIKRRDFFKLSSNALLISVVAFNFGCSINPLVEDKNKKIALIYATRYGATKDTAEWIAKGVDRDIDLLNIENISVAQTLKKYDLFIIGSGIWIDGVHKDILSLLKSYNNDLKDKIVASFIVCGTTNKDVAGEARIAQYFNKFHASLDAKPSLNQHFGGRMIIDKLNKKDKKFLKRDFINWDRTEPEKAREFGKKGRKHIG
jgi:menaquinone-dependent protoporphyrinogen oxidase